MFVYTLLTCLLITYDMFTKQTFFYTNFILIAVQYISFSQVNASTMDTYGVVHFVNAVFHISAYNAMIFIHYPGFVSSTSHVTFCEHHSYYNGDKVHGLFSCENLFLHLICIDHILVNTLPDKTTVCQSQMCHELLGYLVTF